MKTLRVSLLSATSLLAISSLAAQTTPEEADPLSMTGKLSFHAKKGAGFGSLVGSAMFAGAMHELNSPREWGQGTEGYGRRLGSTVATVAIRNAFAFGLDSALGEDPRYVRSVRSGLWPRLRHVVGGTFVTRTDHGGTRFAPWRFASAYGAGYVSTAWYPDRLKTPRLGAEQGTIIIGFDMLNNFGAEFAPDILKKILRR